MSDADLQIKITCEENVSEVFDSLASKGSGLLKKGLEGAAIAAGVLGAGLGFCVNEALESERVQAELNAVIESTGGVAGWSADEANGLAESLMNLTGISDETIVSAESMLLTFTNIGEDVMPRATEAALNMGVKFGDAEQASVMLGKALNDPIAGITALKRVGVTFSEDQERMIQNFMDQGDLASAQAVILDELDKEFGGLAKTVGGTVAGKFNILKNKLGNIAEAIGTALLPAMVNVIDIVDRAFTPVFDYAYRVIAKFVKIVGEEGLGAAVHWLFTTFEDESSVLETFFQRFGMASGPAHALANALNKVITLIIDGFEAVGDVLKRVGGFILSFVGKHIKGLVVGLAAVAAVLVGAAIVSGLLSIGAALAALLNPVTLIIAGIALLGYAWGENFLGIQDATRKVWDWLQPILSELADWIGLAIPIAIEMLTSIFNNYLVPAFNFLRPIVEDIIGVLGRIAQFFGEILVREIQFFVDFFSKVFKGDFSGAWESVKSFASDIMNKLGEGIGDVATWVWNEIVNPLIQGMINADWSSIGQSVLNFFTALASEVAYYLGGGAAWVWNEIIQPLLLALKNADWTDLANTVLNFFTALATHVAGWLGTAAPWVWNNIIYPIGVALTNADWAELANSALNFFSALATEILNFLGEGATWVYDNIVVPLCDRIKETVTEFVAAAQVIGSGIVDGIKQGLSDSWDALVNWFKDKIENGVIGKAMDALGISSPSRVFAGIGEQVIKGLATGLNDFNPVQAALGSGLGDMVGQARSDILPVQGTLAGARYESNRNTQHNWNVTIHNGSAQSNVIEDFNLLKSWAEA